MGESVGDDLDTEECARCGETFERDDLIPIDTGVYCEACYEEIRESSASEEA